MMILLDKSLFRQGLVSIYDGEKDGLLSFLPQSGFVQQAIQQGQKTVGFFSFVAILANNFLPVSSYSNIRLHVKNKNKKSNTKKVELYSLEKQVPHLTGLNRKDKLSIFLGAGISVSCGLPDWTTLLNTLKSLIASHGIHLYDDDDIANVTRKLFGDKFNTVIADCLYGYGVTVSETALSIAHSGVKSIVCFNFDDILEETFQSENIRHNVVLNGEKFNLNSEHTTIFHPHGYLGRFDSEAEQKASDIILSKSDYDGLYLDHYCLTNLIQLSMLMTKTVLFVGMSMTDPNIIRLLKEARKIGVRNWHYAFIKRVNEEHSASETIRLKSLGVDPVWYKEHSDIPRILKQISRKKETANRVAGGV
jgi:NAD-dependent SIR2 family protein deacetylase